MQSCLKVAPKCTKLSVKCAKVCWTSMFVFSWIGILIAFFLLCVCVWNAFLTHAKRWEVKVHWKLYHDTTKSKKYDTRHVKQIFIYKVLLHLGSHLPMLLLILWKRIKIIFISRITSFLEVWVKHGVALFSNKCHNSSWIDWKYV